MGGAENPNPADGIGDIAVDVVLDWSPGMFAVSYDVYFATDFNDINDANASDLTGIYRTSQSRDVNTYAPGFLEVGQTYYWRIDDEDRLIVGIFKTKFLKIISKNTE